MNWNAALFGVFPYIALTLAVAVTAYRMVYRPFSVSAQSSQLLEQKRLFFGSTAMHWGLVIVLLGHLLALLVPKGLLLWNAVPLRLYLLEITGLGLGLWALFGTYILLARRIAVARVRAASTPMDYLVLVVVFVSALTGVLTAVLYRYGSFWFPAVMTPYLWSVLTLSPRPELLQDLPFWTKLHVFNFWLFLALFPFSRLVHIVTVPLGYVVRPWQIVVWVRRTARRETL
ncbi:respiratory nitrate reductase, gamma subunit (plasmid) [Thermus thermophilus SG0.5JP17-16]|uniref:Respiratory nitrate reductase, gamma subunit n=1 Tax=Thermus thermophilus (strain SG0.5JP17-16) TaxID=762633 RepID=F6DJH7_THETG|nr:respiratory nitrate reductase subunit gamma [Thermus thermophilus]AEG34574.1 respiratory nitrate reductase, gamma subunit [Thermus thermophilus SG0.5JP17-16]